MIVSASYRTDIPAFYGRWFRNRLRAGFCTVANPYGGPDGRVPLIGAEVDGFVFWTRNPVPFADALADVADRGFPFVIHLTVTGYPRALDAATPRPERVAEAAHDLARIYGPRAVVWRYDPVLWTALTPPEGHIETFSRLSALMAGACDEVVVSVAQIYRKSARNLDRAEVAWTDPDMAEKRALIADLAGIARGHGLGLSVCAQAELGMAEAACIDAGRLSDVAGRTIETPRKSHRPGCGCWSSRDIGAYDTCPHGCAYCYAVTSSSVARRRHAAHDPDGPKL